MWEGLYNVSYSIQLDTTTLVRNTEMTQNIDKSKLVAELESNISELNNEAIKSSAAGWYETAAKKSIESKTMREMLFLIKQGYYDLD